MLDSNQLDYNRAVLLTAVAVIEVLGWEGYSKCRDVSNFNDLHSKSLEEVKECFDTYLPYNTTYKLVETYRRSHVDFRFTVTTKVGRYESDVVQFIVLHKPVFKKLKKYYDRQIAAIADTLNEVIDGRYPPLGWDLEHHLEGIKRLLISQEVEYAEFPDNVIYKEGIISFTACVDGYHLGYEYTLIDFLKSHYKLLKNIPNYAYLQNE